MRLKRHQEEQGNVRKKDFRSRTPELQREGKKIMTTPRLILSFFFNDTQKPMDVFTVYFSFFFLFYFTIFFFFSLRCLVECVYRSALFRFYIYIFLSVSLRQWYAAPITEEKMSHHGQISYGFIRYCTLGKKCLSFLFFFSGFIFVAHCQSRRGLRGAQRMKVRKRRTDKREEIFTKNSTKCKRTREKKSNKELLRVQRTQKIQRSKGILQCTFSSFLTKCKR